MPGQLWSLQFSERCKRLCYQHERPAENVLQSRCLEQRLLVVLLAYGARCAYSGHLTPHTLVEMSTSLSELLDTLKHLGAVTSRNLEFSYRADVPISYGEETITESNLLELQRRHSDVVHLHTFSKHQESRIGADWAWYIVGRKRTLKMRVQAKRIQRNGVLRIRHAVASSGRQQRELLIRAAHAARMRPMYCIYCTESQRSLWRQRAGRPASGCLLANASDLPLHARNLDSVEWACWPWHFLFERFPSFITRDYFLPPAEVTENMEPVFVPPQPLIWDAPRILDLNEDTDWTYNQTGVEPTPPSDLARLNAAGTGDMQQAGKFDDEHAVEEGSRRTIAIDVRFLT